jgi:hypothetical protein
VPIGTGCEGAAIIHINGVQYVKLGNWTTNVTHEQVWGYYLVNNLQPGYLVYNNVNFMVASAVGNTIHACSGPEGIILKKATTVYVAARYVSGTNPADLSAQMDVVINLLLADGK